MFAVSIMVSGKSSWDIHDPEFTKNDVWTRTVNNKPYIYMARCLLRMEVWLNPAILKIVPTQTYVSQSIDLFIPNRASLYCYVLLIEPSKTKMTSSISTIFSDINTISDPIGLSIQKHHTQNYTMMLTR